MRRRGVIGGGGDPLVVVERHIRDGVGADVAVDRAVQRQDAPLRVQGQARPNLEATALVVAEEGLAAGGRPAHRAADAPGGPDHQQLLQIERGARAEAAAGVGADHLDVLDRDGQRLRQFLPLAHRTLAAGGEAKDAPRLVVFADRRARLHLAGDDTAVLELALDDQMRAVEGALGRIRVAEILAEADVVRALVIERGRAWRDRIVGVDHHGQRPVTHHHQVGRRDGLLQRLGEHHGDRLTHLPHAIDDQRDMAPIEGRLAAEAGRAGIDRIRRNRDVPHRCALIGQIVRAGQHRDHTGRSRRSRDLDGFDNGVRVI